MSHKVFILIVFTFFLHCLWISSIWTIKNKTWLLKCCSDNILKLISSGYSVKNINVLKIISFIILACMRVLFETWNEMDHSIKRLYLNLYMVLSLTPWQEQISLLQTPQWLLVYLFILKLSLLFICFDMGFWFNYQFLYFSYYITYIDGHR